MAIQLTPDQEQRIQAIVEAGTYPSAEEALDAAVAAVEIAAAPGFEGSREEIENMLLDGIDSGEAAQVDEAYWSRLRAETDAIAGEHLKRAR